VHPVGIVGERRLIFWYGILVSKLRPQQLSLGEIGLGCVGHIVDDAGREVGRQTALGVDGSRIERQRVLEQSDRLSVSFARWRPSHKYSTRTEDVVYCVGMLTWPSGLRTPELEVECHCDAARNLVLQREQIAPIAVETLGP